MNSIFALILLQINLLGASGEPMTNTKVFVQDATSGEVVAHVKIGQSGKFKFSNLDPGNYNISLEVPESAVKKLDKKSREKYETNIEVAYNINKGIYCWQRNDGYVTMEVIEKSKIADAVVPKFLLKNEITEDQNTDNQNETQQITVDIFQFTVIGKYGSFGGNLTSVGQREFYNLTVGTKDITLEDAGAVKVLKRFDE